MTPIRSAPQPLPDWRRALDLRWQKLSPRERAALALAAGFLGLLLVVTVLVAPAWRTVRDAPARLDRADLELQSMQSMAAEAGRLRAAAPVSVAQATAALTAATQRLGDSGRLTIQGDRAVLTLKDADGASLRAWLEVARTAARARPVEAQWSRAASGYNGTLVVVLPGSAP